MFDSKMLLVILAIALVIFGTKRLRSTSGSSDLGAGGQGLQAGHERRRIGRKARKQLKQEKDADFDAARRRSETPRTRFRPSRTPDLMLDFGFSELLLTSAIALVVLGPLSGCPKLPVKSATGWGVPV